MFEFIKSNRFLIYQLNEQLYIIEISKSFYQKKNWRKRTMSTRKRIKSVKYKELENFQVHA